MKNLLTSLMILVIFASCVQVTEPVVRSENLSRSNSKIQSPDNKKSGGNGAVVNIDGKDVEIHPYVYETTESSIEVIISLSESYPVSVSYAESLEAIPNNSSAISQDARKHIVTLENLDSGTTYAYRINLHSNGNVYTTEQYYKATTQKALGANAAIITAVNLVENEYRISYYLPGNSLIPEGGYDTYINGQDQNDNSQHNMTNMRVISGLDTTQVQCFRLEARYVQLNPSEFLLSNEVCVQPEQQEDEPAAAVVNSVNYEDGNYIINFSQPANTLIPAGGYDTFINNQDQNDNASYSGYSRVITGLNDQVEQCFKLESRYTQLSPAQFLQSNEICVEAQIETPPPGELKAFPTAEGFGKNATGGRGGSVIYVTNLNDSGPGSLRAAVEASGPRIVVFSVSGYIHLNSDLTIHNPDITIAGQTSPGGGITLKGSALVIRTSNVIIRYMRVRHGDNGYKNAQGEVVGSNSDDNDSITIVGKENGGSNDIILDHMSVSWSIDENIGMWGGNSPTRGIDRLTIQNSIISEALNSSHHDEGSHSMGTLLNAGVTNASFYKNLWAHSKERHIRAGTGSTWEMINNAIYDFRYSCIMGYENIFSMINNHYKNGNESVASSYIADLTSSGGGNIALTKAYITGNVSSTMNEVDSALTPYLQAAPPLSSGIVPVSTSSAVTSILANSGANFPHRDDVDTRIISQYQTGTGQIIDTQEQVGGYPSLPVAQAPTDTDNDGMPNAWEQANGLNPNLNDSAGDADGDGYTNIEEYINSLVGE